MEIIIREIEEKDYQTVGEVLVNDLWDNHFSGDNVVKFFNVVKDDEKYKTFIALADNIVVGVICIVATFSVVSGIADHIHVQNFVVKNEYRGKGIGTKLLRHIEDYGKENNVIGIGLCSGYKRTDAHAFYERNGYSKTITQYFGKYI